MTSNGLFLIIIILKNNWLPLKYNWNTVEILSENESIGLLKNGDHIEIWDMFDFEILIMKLGVIWFECLIN